MKYLDDHNEFEQLIGRQEVPLGTLLPNFTVIYFTATWCGPCRRLDINAIESSVPEANWLKCDIDRNDYTPGYCNVYSIPTFMIIYDTKIVATLGSSNTVQVIEWLNNNKPTRVAEAKKLTE
jgi:thioredoxin-like negative regulator of GroEL